MILSENSWEAHDVAARIHLAMAPLRAPHCGSLWHLAHLGWTNAVAGPLRSVPCCPGCLWKSQQVGSASSICHQLLSCQQVSRCFHVLVAQGLLGPAEVYHPRPLP